jgi:hypothetical protein
LKKQKKQKKLEQRKSAGSDEAAPETDAEVSLDDAVAESGSVPAAG